MDTFAHYDYFLFQTYPQFIEKKSPFKPKDSTLWAIDPQPNTTRRNVPEKLILASDFWSGLNYLDEKAEKTTLVLEINFNPQPNLNTKMTYQRKLSSLSRRELQNAQ